MSHRRAERRILGFEQLETRAMMAGNVVVSVVHHVLEIVGDGSASGNAIIVNQTGRRSYSVVQDPANPTTINGVAGGSFSANHIKMVQVIMGAGPDTATINGSRVKKLDVNMGDGANGLTVNAGRVDKATVVTGGGQDNVTVNSAKMKKVNVSLGAGDDSLKFTNALPRRTSSIDGGAGTNTLTTIARAITANGFVHRDDPDVKMTVLNFQTFA